MPNRVRVLAVRDGDRAELERRARSKSEPARVAQRARIVLLAADGVSNTEIAERVGVSRPMAGSEPQNPHPLHPTSGSWLNLVEIWFGIIERQPSTASPSPPSAS